MMGYYKTDGVEDKGIFATVGEYWCSEGWGSPRDVERYFMKALQLGKMVKDSHGEFEYVEVNVKFAGNTYLTLTRCDIAVKIDITFDLVLYPDILSYVEKSLAAEDTEDLECDECGPLERNLWSMTPADPEFAIKWSSIPMEIRLAVKMLKDNGLLDNLPEGTRFMKERSDLRRWIHIPKYLSSLGFACDDHPSVQEVAVTLYNKEICPVLVNLELVGYKDEERHEVIQDMRKFVEDALKICG